MKDLMSVSKREQSTSISFTDHLSSHILPYYHQIREKYGQNAFIWFGPSPRLLIAEPHLMKEILTRIDTFHKPIPDPIGETIGGGGLSFLEDENWSKHRKIINPAFRLDKLKNMVPAIRLSCASMVSKWEATLAGKRPAEIDVWPYLKDLSGDVISRTAFGSSHEQGRRIFELQNELVKLALELIFFNFVPGWRYIPTRANKRMRAISDETQSLLTGIISQREKVIESKETTPDDLLGILMESNLEEIRGLGKNTEKGGAGMSVQEVIDECKLFYFAGSETTSALLVWTMVMLSKHREWQSRAREEVMRVFGDSEPTYDGLSRLKVVTMILHEVLRLYPSAPVIPRSPTKDVKLGNITLPKGVDMMLLIGLLHHDPDIWGEDANEFKPERFSEGVSGVVKEHQFSYMPFSGGPRICIGQHFAMIEAKVALSMILQRFSFELSDSYQHAPFAFISIEPQKGAPLLLRKL